MKTNLRGVVILCALASGAGACGNSGIVPTGPTGLAPHIVSVTPSVPQQKDGPQRVTLLADGFDAGTILYVAAPDQSVNTFTRSTIQQLAVGYEVFATLSQFGRYVLTAKNAGGAVSDAFSLIVEERVKPSILSIAPGALSVSAASQIVIVTGDGFESGITATLVDGLEGTIVGGAAITGLTRTEFSLHFAFTKPGHYAINLINLSGDVSNTVGVDVAAAGQDAGGGVIL